MSATYVRQSTVQVARLNQASVVRPVYPYWHPRASFLARNPLPVS